MLLNEYQQKTSETAIYPNEETEVNEITDDLFKSFGRMVSDLSVISNAVKKTIRDDGCKISKKRLDDMNKGLNQLVLEMIRMRSIMEYPPNNEDDPMVPYSGEKIARLYTSTGIIDEGLEYFEKCNAINGNETEKELHAIEDELGDALWYVNQAATSTYADMEKIANRNLAKLNKRKEDGVLGGDGDER